MQTRRATSKPSGSSMKTSIGLSGLCLVGGLAVFSLLATVAIAAGNNLDRGLDVAAAQNKLQTKSRNSINKETNEFPTPSARAQTCDCFSQNFAFNSVPWPTETLKQTEDKIKRDNRLSLRPVRTYEQLALCGSRLRLVCPHARVAETYTLSNTFGQASNGRHVRSKPRAPQVDAGGRGQEISPEQLPESTLATNHQVKWFRNHVPILDPDHFQPSDQHSQRDTIGDSQVPQDRDKSSVEGASTKRGPSETVIGLDQSSQTREHSESLHDGPSSGRKWQHPLDVAKENSGARDGNVNEAPDCIKRKRANLSLSLPGNTTVNEQYNDQHNQTATCKHTRGAKNSYCINTFGELVINRVTEHFAGKYTCLFAGQLSELLLDVVSAEPEKSEDNEEEASGDKRNDENEAVPALQTGARRRGGGVPDGGAASVAKTHDDYERVGKIRAAPSSEPNSSGLQSSVANYSAALPCSGNCRPGNGQTQAEPRGRGYAQLRSANKPMLDLFGKISISGESRLGGSVRTSRQAQDVGGDKVGPLSGSIPHSFSSIPLQRGKPERSDSNQLGAAKSFVSEANYFDPAVTSDSERTHQEMPKLKQASWLWRGQIHRVESESILMEDLKLIPGLLYTKQQFFCPRLASDNLNRVLSWQTEHIAKTICSGDESAVVRPAPRLNTRESSRCNRVVNCLVTHLVNSQEDFLESTSNLNDVIWLKNGKRIDFDANGIGLGSDNNMKLIDSCDQFKRMSNMDAIANKNGDKKNPPSNAFVEFDSLPAAPANRSADQSQQSRTKWTAAAPLRGSTLEIDGVRKDNAGLYSCALKLSVNKLDNILKGLRRQANKPFSAMRGANCNRDTNLSCCDEQEGYGARSGGGGGGFGMDEAKSATAATATPFDAAQQHTEEGTPFETGAGRAAQQSTTFNSQGRAAIPLPAEATNQRKAKNNPNRAGNPIASSLSNVTLAERIAILDSIVGGELLANEKLLESVGNSLVHSAQRLPIASVQTFALVVVERPANLSSIWSTIFKADGAYLRRRSADFRRLKRRSLHSAASNQPRRRRRSAALPEEQLPTTRPATSLALGAAGSEPQANSKARPDNNRQVGGGGPKRAEAGLMRARDEAAAAAAAIEVVARPSGTIGNDLPLVLGDAASGRRRRRGGRAAGAARAKDEAEPIFTASPTSDTGQHERQGPRSSLLNNAAAKAAAAAAAAPVAQLGTENTGEELESTGEPPAANSGRQRALGAPAAERRRQEGRPQVGASASSFNYAYEMGNLRPADSSLAPAPRRDNVAAPLDLSAAAAATGAGRDGPRKTALPRAAPSGRPRPNRRPRSLGPQAAQRPPSKPPSQPSNDYAAESETKDLIPNADSHRINIKRVRGGATLIGNAAGGAQYRGRPISASGAAGREPPRADSDDLRPRVAPAESAPTRRQDGAKTADNLIDGNIGRPSGGEFDEIALAQRQRPRRARERPPEAPEKVGLMNSTETAARRSDQMGAPFQVANGPARRLKTRYRRGASDKLAGANRRPRRSVASVAQGDAAPLAISQLDSADDSDRDGADLIERVPNAAATDAADDESLLWAAGQYLFMRMRALASSSLYGAQVDVEWSNERANRTNIDPASAAAAARDDETANKRQNGDGDDLQTRRADAAAQSAPFATIDLVPGQDLHLQCTAEVLGRLAEVRWYKRVRSISSELVGAELASLLARKIGSDLFWPLTELDLLRETATSRGAPFVCSQSITVFDNLVNQTFTVVNSLQLSHYNDVDGDENLNRVDGNTERNSEMAPTAEADSDKRFSLYACIVDADVRHNYATLGVNFRLASSGRLRRRLRAHSIFGTQQAAAANLAAQNSDPANEVDLAKLNFLRQEHLHFPLTDVWVPIKNGTSSLNGVDEFGVEFPIAPAMLTVIIVFVFATLLALVFLTLKSYQALTSFQLDDEDNLPSEQFFAKPDDVVGDGDDDENNRRTRTLRGANTSSLAANDCRRLTCTCRHLEAEANNGSDERNTSFTAAQNNVCPNGSISYATTTLQSESGFFNKFTFSRSSCSTKLFGSPLYSAHSHSSGQLNGNGGNELVCSAKLEGKLSQSTSAGACLYENCCNKQLETLPTSETRVCTAELTDRLVFPPVAITMIENPLNNCDEYANGSDQTG